MLEYLQAFNQGLVNVLPYPDAAWQRNVCYI